LLIAGAFATGASADRNQEQFSRELAGRVAGPAQECVPIQQAENLRIVDQRTLAYGTGRTLWVNRLESDCPGMQAMDRLIVDVHGSEYCRHDHFRSVGFSGSIPGPVCFLGKFTPYRRTR
jgi:hypothetical protein